MCKRVVVVSGGSCLPSYIKAHVVGSEQVDGYRSASL